MALPSPDEIKSSTEKGVRFIEWLAEVLRGKNWVQKLVLIGVADLLFCNPPAYRFVLKLFGRKELSPGDQHYTIVWISSVAILFLLALVVALWTVRRKTAAAVVDVFKPTAIKGLQSFEMKDAELFARLQRQQQLAECLTAITSSDFRFGQLKGESGCGKSSFLQAGLRLGLNRHPVPHGCIYVKFTDHDPLALIRNALIEQIPLAKEKAQDLDLLPLLQVVQEAKAMPLVLIFDQFEQFFVHRKLKLEREPFIKALAAWYRQPLSAAVKILVCVRSDFVHYLDELQKAMGYSLSPSQNFRLEKFEPKEATEIIRVIAETENLGFDERFIEEIATRELAGDDGLISPVDLQILSWMLAGQKSSEDRAFTPKAYQRLGGVEGLLERYVMRALEARETMGRRQAALKVLLVLTDLERNVRAGVLSVEEIQKKVAGTMPADEIQEAVGWLVRSDVRLITATQRNGEQGYELAHERLIPAIRRLSGKQLLQADRASQLLDRRVNEWLGNDHARRYLLTWKELYFIKRQRPYLTWGPQRPQKEELLAKSTCRWRAGAGAIALAGLLVLGGISWLFSPWGQIWQIQRDLIAFTNRITDAGALREAAVTLVVLGRSDRAMQALSRITDPSAKARTVGDVAEAMAKVGNSAQAVALLEKAREVAEGITDPSAKARALGVVAEAIAKIGATAKDAALLEKAREVAEGITNPFAKARALGVVAEAIAKIGNPAQAVALLEKTREVAEGITDPSAKARVLGAVAEANARLGRWREARSIAARTGNEIDHARTLAAILTHWSEPQKPAAEVEGKHEGD